MQPDIGKILLETDLCVLCTSKHDVPDASLMLYASDDSCAKLYMLTLEDTDKYRNIRHNPNVSILVDTRNAADGAAWTKALTIHGEASIISSPEASREWIGRLAGRHAQLSNLAGDAGVRVIEVLMKHVLFLESVDKGRDIAL
ncbi:MAG: pyridoxamine 5'-phosphate oxidase family protein [Eubacteriales bacterium]|nr:pyridoxamine 5'-phosphate oxidase family protein [Eubacteriales bacterium]